MADNTILVLGGTGKVGGRVAARLRDSGTTVRAASRAGETRFDWHDDRTWEPALDKATEAFLVDSLDGDPIAKLRAFSDLAAANGVRRLVLLSARQQENGGTDISTTEQAIKDSGAEWTVLRPTWFAQNFSETPMIRNPLAAGELALPAGQGPQPFIDADDIAAVAVEALTGNGHAGRTYDLSGPEALTFAQAVEQIAAATGRALRYRAVDPQEYTANPDAFGVNAQVAQLYVYLMGFIAAGRTAELSDGVQRVLGREPGRFGDYVARTVGTGVWAK